MDAQNNMEIKVCDTPEKQCNRNREKISAVVFAFILGIIFDYFFYDKIPGISYPIFNILLLCCFIYFMRDRIEYKRPMGWFLLLSVLLLSARAAVYSDEVLNAVNFLIVPFLIAAYTIIVSRRDSDWSKFSFLAKMMEYIFAGAFSNMFKPFVFIWECLRNGDKKNYSSRRNVLIGFAVSLPLLLIIIPLLASADEMFGYYIGNIISIINVKNVLDSIGHIILIMFIFLYTFGYMWSFKHSHSKNNNEINIGIRMEVDTQIITTVLVVTNIIYLLFTILQFSYLYSGFGGGLPQGYTYADYARRGFFELAAVAAINFFILILSMKLMKRDGRRTEKSVRILLCVLVLFTLNMLFSAHIRMSLYEESYGFTQLRMYVHIFMLIMLVLFIIALLKIWFERISLFKMSFISVMVMYIAINYMNIDAVIAENNIERYGRTGKVDIRYLSMLSDDALPQIVEFAKSAHLSMIQDDKGILNSRYELLDYEFGWMEYNYSRNMARIILKEYLEQGEK